MNGKVSVLSFPNQSGTNSSRWKACLASPRNLESAQVTAVFSSCVPCALQEHLFYNWRHQQVSVLSQRNPALECDIDRDGLEYFSTILS